MSGFRSRRPSGPLVVRVAIGLGLVLAQLTYGLVVHLSNCCAERYFAWAPNDYSVDYHIAATVNGQKLSSAQILGRYRIAQTGFWEDPVERLEGVLRRRELAYGTADSVSLVVDYTLDGHAPAQWHWSNDR